MSDTVELVEVVYEVTIYMEEDADGIPTEEELQKAIYRGVKDIASEEHVQVARF